MISCLKNSMKMDSSLSTKSGSAIQYRPNIWEITNRLTKENQIGSPDSTASHCPSITVNESITCQSNNLGVMSNHCTKQKESGFSSGNLFQSVGNSAIVLNVSSSKVVGENHASIPNKTTDQADVTVASIPADSKATGNYSRNTPRTTSNTSGIVQNYQNTWIQHIDINADNLASKDFVQERPLDMSRSVQHKVSEIGTFSNDLELSHSIVDLTEPEDATSQRGVFGWTIIDNISIPHILRYQNHKYVEVRVVEQKLLSKYPPYLMSLVKKKPIKSYRLTVAEAKLFNEINANHCNYEYGTSGFHTHDVVVKLQDFQDFYTEVTTVFMKSISSECITGLPQNIEKTQDIMQQSHGYSVSNKEDIHTKTIMPSNAISHALAQSNVKVTDCNITAVINEALLQKQNDNDNNRAKKAGTDDSTFNADNLSNTANLHQVQTQVGDILASGNNSTLISQGQSDNDETKINCNTSVSHNADHVQEECGSTVINVDTCGGWLQINNTVSPFIRRQKKGLEIQATFEDRYVPLPIVKYAAGLLKEEQVADNAITDIELEFLDNICSSAGLNFKFSKNTTLVAVSDVKKHTCCQIIQLPSINPFEHAQYVSMSETSESLSTCSTPECAPQDIDGLKQVNYSNIGMQQDAIPVSRQVSNPEIQQALRSDTMQSTQAEVQILPNSVTVRPAGPDIHQGIRQVSNPVTQQISNSTSLVLQHPVPQMQNTIPSSRQPIDLRMQQVPNSSAQQVQYGNVQHTLDTSKHLPCNEPLEIHQSSNFMVQTPDTGLYRTPYQDRQQVPVPGKQQLPNARMQKATNRGMQKESILRFQQALNPGIQQAPNARINLLPNPVFQPLNPRMQLVSNPEFLQATNPRMQQVLNHMIQPQTNPRVEQLPMLQQVSNPWVQQGNNPRMQQVPNPEIQQAINPRMQLAANQMMQQVSNPVIQQTPNLGMAQATDLRVQQLPNIGMQQVPNLWIQQATSQGMSQMPNPGVQQTTNLIIPQVPYPGIQQVSNPGRYSRGLIPTEQQDSLGAKQKVPHLTMQQNSQIPVNPGTSSQNFSSFQLHPPPYNPTMHACYDGYHEYYQWMYLGKNNRSTMPNPKSVKPKSRERRAVSTNKHSPGHPPQRKPLNSSASNLSVLDNQPSVLQSKSKVQELQGQFLPSVFKKNGKCSMSGDVHFLTLHLFNKPVTCFHSIYREQEDLLYILLDDVRSVYFSDASIKDVEYATRTILNQDRLILFDVEKVAVCTFFGLCKSKLESDIMINVEKFMYAYRVLKILLDKSPDSIVPEDLPICLVEHSASSRLVSLCINSNDKTHYSLASMHSSTDVQDCNKGPGSATVVQGSPAVVNNSSKAGSPVSSQEMSVQSQETGSSGVQSQDIIFKTYVHSVINNTIDKVVSKAFGKGVVSKEFGVNDDHAGNNSISSQQLSGSRKRKPTQPQKCPQKTDICFSPSKKIKQEHEMFTSDEQNGHNTDIANPSIDTQHIGADPDGTPRTEHITAICRSKEVQGISEKSKVMDKVIASPDSPAGSADECVITRIELDQSFTSDTESSSNNPPIEMKKQTSPQEEAANTVNKALSNGHQVESKNFVSEVSPGRKPLQVVFTNKVVTAVKTAHAKQCTASKNSSSNLISQSNESEINIKSVVSLSAVLGSTLKKMDDIRKAEDGIIMIEDE